MVTNSLTSMSQLMVMVGVVPLYLVWCLYTWAASFLAFGR